MSMQQFDEWMRSDNEGNASLTTMHVLTDTPVDDLVAPGSGPDPLGSWSMGWS